MSADYFDYYTLAMDAGLTESDIVLVAKMVRKEYPTDDMLFELHMLRVCRAIKDGFITLEQVLDSAA